MQPFANGSSSNPQFAMSSPAPLLRPPVPGGRRKPHLGLSIPASPNARPVVNGSSDGPQPMRPRPMPPSLSLATPMGSNTVPHEGRQLPRVPPLQIGTGLSASGSSDASAHSRSGSFGEMQANGGSATSYQATLSFPSFQRPHQGSDPISAISAISQGGSEGAPSMERQNSAQPLPDLDAMAAEKGRPLEVDDLDNAAWMAASAKGMIEEQGSLGEGAGGAVTRCKLKGGKTVFALKVRPPHAILCAHQLTMRRSLPRIPIQTSRSRLCESYHSTRTVPVTTFVDTMALLKMPAQAPSALPWSSVKADHSTQSTAKSRS